MAQIMAPLRRINSAKPVFDVLTSSSELLIDKQIYCVVSWLNTYKNLYLVIKLDR